MKESEFLESIKGKGVDELSPEEKSVLSLLTLKVNYLQERQDDESDHRKCFRMSIASWILFAIMVVAIIVSLIVIAYVRAGGNNFDPTYIYLGIFVAASLFLIAAIFFTFYGRSLKKGLREKERNIKAIDEAVEAYQNKKE